MEPKVSIVTPCYNGEKFIDQYMKMLLNQVFLDVELILVDDGSTDDSLNVIESWRNKVEEKGITFTILSKENGGQPSAINAGFAIARGKYITWPDIDDIMMPDCILRKVEYLEEHLDEDMVISRSMVVDEKNIDRPLRYTWEKEAQGKDDLMERILDDKDVDYVPGDFMIRSLSLDRFIKDRHIYDQCGSWSGAQFQIMFPFFFRGNVGCLNKCLNKYVLHENNDHNKFKTEDQLKQKSIIMKEVMVATIKSLNSEAESELIDRIERRMVLWNANVAFSLGAKKWFMDAYNETERGERNFKIILKKIIISNQLLYQIFLRSKKI